jgi:hypothetical protein
VFVRKTRLTLRFVRKPDIVTKAREAAMPRRKRIINTLQGPMTVTEAARVAGINREQVYRRLKRWPLIRLLEPPHSYRNPGPHNRIIETPRGPMTITAAARIVGLTHGAMYGRLSLGWPVARLLDPPAAIDTPRGRMTVAAAARIAGITREAMRQRLKKGWPASQLLEPPGTYKPGRGRRARVIDTPRGPMTIADLARICGVRPSVMHGRLARGWPVARWFEQHHQQPDVR